MDRQGRGEERAFRACIDGLLRGDFSRLEPEFTPAGAGETPRLVSWVEERRFDAEPAALAEALTCACFLGRIDVVDALLARGVDPRAGTLTGLDAMHWAANRGHATAVRLLLAHGVPFETTNRFGSTALGLAVWSAVHEARPGQIAVIEALLAAGANVAAAGYPSGDSSVDRVLERAGAKR